MATYKKQLRDKDNNVIYPAQGLGTITSENIDWTTLASTPWVDGTFNSGFTTSSNANYNGRKIQACIYAGFLFIRFAASRTSGNFAVQNEYTIGTIPSTVGGVDISNLTTLAKGNMMRFALNGGSANCGWCQLNGTSIVIEFKTGEAGWCVGEMMIPLNI